MCAYCCMYCSGTTSDVVSAASWPAELICVQSAVLFRVAVRLLTRRHVLRRDVNTRDLCLQTNSVTLTVDISSSAGCKVV